MKVKITKENGIAFLHEILDEYGEACTYYGLTMDRPGEEQAADDYERAWAKVQTAMKLVFKTELEVTDAD